MPLETMTFLIGVASFIGAIAGAMLSNLVTARLASQERKEARYKDALTSLRKTMDDMVEVYAKFMYEDHSGLMTNKWREQSARFAAICFSLGDQEMTGLGRDILTPEVNKNPQVYFEKALSRISEITNEFVAKHRLE